MTVMATFKTTISSLFVLSAVAAVPIVGRGAQSIASSDLPKAQTDSVTVQPVAQPQCGGDTKSDTKKPTS